MRTMRAKGEYTKAAGLNEVIEEAERHRGLTPEEIKYLEERRRQKALELENYVPYYCGLE